jgi:hypothetical protein
MNNLERLRYFGVNLWWRNALEEEALLDHPFDCLFPNFITQLVLDLWQLMHVWILRKFGEV